MDFESIENLQKAILFKEQMIEFYSNKKDKDSIAIVTWDTKVLKVLNDKLRKKQMKESEDLLHDTPAIADEKKPDEKSKTKLKKIKSFDDFNINGDNSIIFDKDEDETEAVPVVQQIEEVGDSEEIAIAAVEEESKPVFKYIEPTGKVKDPNGMFGGPTQTERLLVEDHQKFLYIKQGGPGGHQVYVDKVQALQLVELIQKFINKK